MKVRNSNIELLRIICMLSVVASHAVAYSGIRELFDFSHPSINMLFCQIWGMWGKTAINVFVLITGYYMCEAQQSTGKFWKLLLQVKFYDFAIFALIVFCGLETLSWGRVWAVCVKNSREVNLSFTGSFLLLYLLIPFLNRLISALSGTELRKLVLLLVVLFTAIPFLVLNPGFNHVSWYVVVYLIGAAIRKCPFAFMSSLKWCIVCLVGFLALSFLSVGFIDFVAQRCHMQMGLYAPYYLVHNSNKPLALCVSVFCFLTFKNLNMIQSRGVNLLASGTFGVLLIHDSGPAIRELIWVKIFHLASAWGCGIVIVRLILATLVTYLACAFLDVILWKNGVAKIISPKERR